MISPRQRITICLFGISAIATFALAAETNGIIKNIPGGKTATGIMASSLDAGSRYLAPDGPIQPAITAVGGLPLRGAELANGGISRISSGLDNEAQRLSRAAGNGGNVDMPGMQALESMMPASISQLGGNMRNMIRQKNNFIRGQAESAISSANRQGEAIRNGFNGLAQNSLGNLGNMMNGAQNAMMKGSSQVQNQLKRSVDEVKHGAQAVQGLGNNVRNQARGITKTLSNGLSNGVQNIQQTGEQLRGQLSSGLHQNMGTVSGMMGSMQNRVSNLGQGLQNNLQSAAHQAQNAASKVTSRLQRSLSAPIEMLSNLGNGIGSMAQNAGGAVRGRY